MNDHSNLEIRRRKASFRAYRRGFREVDMIFSAFAEAHLDSLDETELEQFEALLKAPDRLVFNWFMGYEPVPAEFDNSVFARLCAYRENLAASQKA